MGNNIGIKVNVNFPSQAELQRKLDGYNLTAKINFKASKEGIDNFKNQIGNIKGLKAKVSIDTEGAKSKIDTLSNKVKSLDKLLSKNRSLKLSVDLKDFDKSLAHLVGALNNQSIGKNLAKPMTLSMKTAFADINKQMKNLQKDADKVSTTVKRNADGETTSHKKQYVTKDGGKTKTYTYDAVSGKSEVKVINDKEKAVKAYGEQLKKIHKLEDELSSAQTKQAKDALRTVLKAEKDAEKEMRNGVKKEYGSTAITSSSLIAKMQNDRKDDVAKRGRARKELKELKDMQSIYSKYVAKAKELEALKTKSLTAGEKEREQIEQQIKNADAYLKRLEKSNNNFQKLSASQKNEALGVVGSGDNKRKIIEARNADKESAKEIAENQKKINNAFNDYINKQKALGKIKKALVSADGSEKDALVAKKNALKAELQMIQSKYDGVGLNDAQRKTLSETIGNNSDAVRLARAKAEDKQLSDQKAQNQKNQNNAVGEYIKKQKALANVEQAILEAGVNENEALVSRQAQLKSELSAIKEKSNGFKDIDDSQKKRFADAQKEVAHQKSLASSKKEDKQRDKEKNDEQRKLNNAFNDYLNKQKAVGKLEKDMIGAKDGEKAIMAQKRDSLNSELNALDSKYNGFKGINDAQKESLKNTLAENSYQKQLAQTKKNEQVAQKKASEENSKRDNAFKNYLNNHKALGKVQKELVNASGEEKAVLESKRDALKNEIDNLGRKYDNFKDINDVQRESLKNAVKESNYAKEVAEAKKSDKANDAQKAEEQKKLNNAYADYARKREAVSKIDAKLESATGNQRSELENRKSQLEAQIGNLEQKYKGFRDVSDEDKEKTAQKMADLSHQKKMAQAQESDRKEKQRELEKNENIKGYLENMKKVHDLQAKLDTMDKNSEVGKSIQRQVNAHQDKANDFKQKENNFSNLDAKTRADMAYVENMQKLRASEQRAKKDDSIQSTKESNMLAKAKKELKEIYDLKKKIADIEGRGATRTGDSSELNRLKQELEMRQQIARTRDNSNLNNQSRNELGHLNAAYKSELQGYQATAQRNGELEKANHLLSEYQKQLGKVNSLQQQMVYAGSREQRIISSELGEQQGRLNGLRNQIESNRHITQEQRQQIDNERALQREANRTAQARQKARQKDQAYRDSDGAIDFRDTAQSFEMGFRTTLESMERVDTAYMKVAKVANTTDAELAKFKQSSFKNAASLGVSADEYMDAVSTWVTAGKGWQEAQDLSKVSLMGSFVGNIDVNDMVKYMSVPLTAYADAGLEATDVINTMNEVSNTNAIEMGEIGKAYQRSATSVKAYGVTFGELTGMITGAQEETRMGGERIGTAMKTMSINYGLIQSQQTAAQKKKYNFFQGLGIDLKDKSFYEVMESLHGMWGDLTKAEKATAAFNLAGKEHTNIMNGIISQWDTVEEAKNTAEGQYGLGEDGSAYIEFEKQQESVRFKVKALSTAWDEFLNKLGESGGAMSKALSALTNGLHVLSNLMDNDLFTGALFGGMGLVAIHGMANGIRRLFDVVSNGVKRSVGDVRDLSTSAAGVYRSMARGNTRVARDNDSNRNNSRDDRDNNNRDNDSNIITRSGRNGNNNNDEGNTRRTRRSQRNEGNNTGDSDGLDRTERSASKLGGTLKKVLGIIPLIGDAMLVAELLGVPVFETIGKAIKKVSGETEELTKKTKKYAKEVADNEINNGTTKRREREVKNLREDTKKDAKDGKYGKYFTEKQFKKKQKKFNSTAESLGSKERITANDYDEIIKKEKKLAAVKTKLAKEAGKSNAKSVFKNQGVKEDSAKEITKQIQAMKKAEKQLKNFKKASKDAFAKGKSDQGMAFNLKADDAAKDIKKASDAIKKLKAASKDAGKSMSEIGNAMNKLDPSSIKDAFSGLNMGEAAAVASEMGSSLEQIRQKAGDTHDALAKLGDVKINKGEFEAARAEIAKYDESVNSISYDAFMNNTNGARDKMMELANQANNTAQEELKIGNAAMDSAIMVMAGMGMTVSSISEATGATEDYIRTLAGIPPNADTSVKATVTGKSEVDGLVSSIGNVHDKSATITVKKVFTQIDNMLTGKGRNSYVSMRDSSESPNEVSTSPSVSSVSNNVSSNSSSSDNGSISTGVIPEVADKNLSDAVVSISGTTSSKSTSKGSKSSKKSSKKDDNNSKVDSDVWRYWKTEIALEKLEDSFSNLERQVELAGDNYKKLNALYKKELRNYDATISKNVTYRSQKESEINSVLVKLRKYGFKTNTKTNTVSNLGHAKDLKGKNAEKADDLLSTYRSLVSDLADISQTILEAKAGKKQVLDSDKDSKINDEANRNAKRLEKSDRTIRTVERNSDINTQYLDFLSDGDYEKRLQQTESAMNSSKQNVSALVAEFNSLAKLQQEYPENAQEIADQLESISDQIKTESLSVLEYKQALKDIKLERIVGDFDKFTEAVERSQTAMDSLKNTVQGGFISGQDFGDLQATQMGGFEIKRKNTLSATETEYIKLARNLNKLMNTYEKKNVLKLKDWADKKVEITKDMYRRLAKLSYAYNKKEAKTKKKPTVTKTKQVTATKTVKKYKDTTKAKDSKGKKVSSSSRLNSFLKENNLKTTAANKKKLAKKYGIKNYKGTQKQQEALYKAMSSAKKTVTKTKTVKKYSKGQNEKTLNAFLKANSLKTTKANKEKLAKEYGIKNYKGTKAQDAKLLEKMKKKTKTATVKNKETTTYLKANQKTVKKYSKSQNTKSLNTFLKANNLKTTKANKEKLAKEVGIKNYKGTKAQNDKLLKKLKAQTKTTNGKAIKKTVKTNKTVKKYDKGRNSKSLKSFLKANGIATDMKKMTQLAKQYGMKTFTGTKEQQNKLLELMKKATKTVTESATKYYDKAGKEITKAKYEKLYGGATKTSTPTASTKTDSFSDAIAEITAAVTEALSGGESNDSSSSYDFDSDIDMDVESEASKAINAIAGSTYGYGAPKYLEQAYNRFIASQNYLTSKYTAQDLNTNNATKSRYLWEQTQNQEQLETERIAALKLAIEELEKEKAKSTMTTDDVEELNDQINTWKDEIQSSQESIRELIASRFQYEFDYLDETLNRYAEFADDVEFIYSSIDFFTGDNTEEKLGVMTQEYKNQMDYVADIQRTIEGLQKQMSTYDLGSYEWNLLNEKVKEYKETLEDVNVSLLEISKNMMNLNISKFVKGFEMSVLGKTFEDWNTWTESWAEGVEKSLLLEQIHQQAKDAEVTTFNGRLEELAGQEKVSRNELDLIKSQIELEELRKKMADLQKERDVQVLKQQADGTWDFEYESSNEEDVEKQITDKKLEIEQMLQGFLRNYMAEIEEVTDKAKDGTYATEDDFRDVIEEINASYEPVLSKDKLLTGEQLDDIINTYKGYISDVQTNTELIPKAETVDLDTNGVDTGVLKAYFDGFNVSSQIGNLATPVITTLQSTVSRSVSSTDNNTGNVVIENLSFPSVTSESDIKQAILDLPRFAKQKANEKQ